MKFMSTLKLICACTLAIIATSALAHGDGKEHAKAAASTIKKEQKPWGVAGDAEAATRTITLKMTDDMRFTPDKLDIRLGETVKLVMRNDGKVMHELVIGTKKELDEHAAMMMKHPGMEHNAPYTAHVPPGKTGEIVWSFNRAGDFDFACLIAGHYQAGMVGKIKVTAK